ncbi:MAG: NAD(P)-dependent oxidoreductase [Rhizobiaceae bacterium]
MVGNTPKHKDGIASGRLGKKQAEDNFSDLHPPLDHHEALVESDRCYFCYDAPCMTACPTSIDIPLFIRQISTGTPMAAAETIFEQNILGGMCARVCPTETLCEEVCVRETAEGKPVKIGLLQRYATDKAMTAKKQFFKRGKSTRKRVAVVGAGPAGLACAHRLAMHGYKVTIYDANKKPGGLNEYGIAAYKSTDDFAQHEVDYVTKIGGIDIQYSKELGKQVSIESLADKYHAVFLGMGMSGVNALGLKGKQPEGVEDAVDFISKLRQTKNKSRVAIGRRVVVIGGGMTAVDAAVQAKLLGAEEVTIAYRRGAAQMNASEFEQDLAAIEGVTVRHWLQPKKFKTSNGKLSGIELEYTALSKGKLSGTGETITLKADQVFSAIGQSLITDELGASIQLAKGRIKTKEDGRTSVAGIWAGGDCTNQGEDLTVTAVAQGRDAADSIHTTLSA